MSIAIRQAVTGGVSSPLRIVVLIAALVAALTLAFGPAGTLAVAPFTVLLACPLMHVFMSHRHGRHGSSQN